MATVFEFPYRTVVEINLQAIVKNLSTLRTLTRREVIPVIKADAYGHGMIPIAKVLLHRGGVQMLAVATLEEAIELRQHFHRHFSILVLSGFMPHQWEVYRSYNIVPQLHSLYHVQSLKGLKEVPEVHLKIDSGMNRLGIKREEMEETLSILKSSGGKLAGVSTHFAESENSNSKFVDQQIEVFEGWLGELKKNSLLTTDARIHLANSGGVIQKKLSCSTAIRPGVALFGISPNPLLNTMPPLVPVLTWKSRLISIKKLKPGESVGYGRTYTARENETVGVVPVGYADGLHRSLSNRGELLIQGKRAKIRGRVSMDMVSVDLTDIPDAAIGDLATVIGRQYSQEITAWDISHWGNTLPYEVFCGISPRVSRIYLDSDAT